MHVADYSKRFERFVRMITNILKCKQFKRKTFLCHLPFTLLPKVKVKKKMTHKNDSIKKCPPIKCHSWRSFHQISKQFGYHFGIYSHTNWSLWSLLYPKEAKMFCSKVQGVGFGIWKQAKIYNITYSIASDRCNTFRDHSKLYDSKFSTMQWPKG